MNTRTFYVIAEIRRDADGRVLPKRCVSGPYAEYLLARQVRDVLGDNYHVFEATDFKDACEMPA